MKTNFLILAFLLFTCYTALNCTTGNRNNSRTQHTVLSDNKSNDFSFNYNLKSPETFLELPAILDEISGITAIDSSHISCVQDELGIAFIYNFVSDSIIITHKFDSAGDFEGIASTKKSLYILRSDGRLMILKNFNPFVGIGQISHQILSLQSKDNEGLCFDKKNNCLLIAAKSKPINHDHKSERYIYRYDLVNEVLNTEPFYKINVLEVEKACEIFNIEITPEFNKKGKAKPFNFRPSDIAIHPNNEHIYILSASDKLLIVINRDGAILHVEKLDEKLFPKAEGLTFLENGTLLISNEGVGKKPTLLIFHQKK